MKKIAIMTSGGDAPGMNPAIRAVARTALSNGLEVVGVQRGYKGILNKEFSQMDLSSVGNIIQRGGTILKCSRCPEFHKPEFRKEAAQNLKAEGIDGLVVLGGDGSFNGAFLFSKENNFPVMGIPCTIDNDITGTQYSIGFDTATQTAIEAVDKIRDTASSHERTFIVEVMGRSSSSIATHVGVCTGAEDIITSDKPTNYEEIAAHINRGIQRGKTSSILIVAEGNTQGYSYEVARIFKEEHGIESRVCILGHIQRGGSPSALDRFIASAMGFHAIQGLISGKHRHVTAFVEGYTEIKPMEDCLAKKNDYFQRYQELAQTLSI